MSFKITGMDPEIDFEKGFLRALDNLKPTDLSPEEAKEIHNAYIKHNPVYHIFVAKIEGEVVGVITLLIEQKFIHGGGKVGHIEDVSVRQGFERAGIGKALVEAAVKRAEEKKCYKVILDCSEENMPFYEKCGFHKHSNEMRKDL